MQPDTAAQGQNASSSSRASQTLFAPSEKKEKITASMSSACFFSCFVMANYVFQKDLI